MIRRRRTTRPPSVRWNLYIPQHIAAIIDNEMWSSVYQRPSYGQRQKLVIQLLEKHIAENNLASQPIRLGTGVDDDETATLETAND